MTIRLILAVALGSTLLLSGCGSDPEEAKPRIDVTRAWARATAPGQDVGGVFLTIRNDGEAADRLVGGTSPAASGVEIHRSSDEGGVARMRQLKALDIPVGDSVTLAPGDTHLMLVGLKLPLEAGKTVNVTLDFAASGKKTVEARIMPVQSDGPKPADDE